MIGAASAGMLAVAARGLALAAIVVVAGVAAFEWAVLPQWSAVDADASRQHSARSSRIGAWSATMVAIVAPARLYLQARSLVDVADPVLPMMSNVLRTTWGRGWSLQLASSVAVLAGFVLASQRVRGAWLLALPATLLLALSPALMGHAIAADRLVLASVGSDWLHVTAAGAWIGCLSLVTIIIVSMHGASDGAPAASLVMAFHPVALSSASALVVTGVVSLLFRVRHLSDLFHSPYGAILGVKLTLTGGVMAFGWHHGRHGPRLALGDTRRALIRSLAAEMILAALVIAATALLVGTAPPMSDTPSMT